MAQVVEAYEPGVPCRRYQIGKPVLTAREEAFISDNLEGSSKDAPTAAAKAGYKSPHKIASKLMH